jgi:hypothetical protein
MTYPCTARGLLPGSHFGALWEALPAWQRNFYIQAL